jgi:gluconolactonase
MGAREEAGKFTCLARDISGAEGPCYTRDGRILLVGPDQGRIVEVRPDGTPVDLANTGGIPAGLQVDRNNDLWVADMGRGLLRVSMAGRVFLEVAEFEGRPIRGCNDLTFDGKGNLYFTAPGAPVGADSKGRSSLEDPAGEIFCRLSDGTLRRLDGGYAFCNGLAVAAGDLLLIVAETLTKRLWAYDLPSPGAAVNKRIWATLPGKHDGGPDGMDFDERGRLLVANWGGGAIEIFEADGSAGGRIPAPFASPSNVHFLGGLSRSLLITEHSSNGLWLTEHDAAGQVQYGLG